jgi:hypothetical protein
MIEMKDIFMRWLWIKIKRLAEEVVNGRCARFCGEKKSALGRWGAIRYSDMSPFHTVITVSASYCCIKRKALVDLISPHVCQRILIELLVAGH